MGQQEVLKLLRQHDNQKFTAQQLATLLKTNTLAVGNSLRKLRYSKIINYSNKNKEYLYWAKP